MLNRERGSTRVTLKDVAARAGVSVQTASHVMAQTASVRLPESTRERVRSAANELGYRPNRLAQAMRSQRTNLVALWIPVDRTSLNYLTAIREVNLRTRMDGYEMLMMGIDPRLAYLGEGRHELPWPVDGLIAFDAGKAVRQFRDDPSNDDIPVLVVGMEHYLNADNTYGDTFEGACRGMNHLMESRPKHCVHITPSWIMRDYPREKRRTAYEQVVTENGLMPAYISVEDETVVGAEKATANYIEEHGLPDAIFGFSDTLAIGAASAVIGLGYQVPNHCRILGFGGTPEAEIYRVPISTLRLPIALSIEEGWKMLRERIEGYRGPTRELVQSLDLIIRDSSWLGPS